MQKVIYNMSYRQPREEIFTYQKYFIYALYIIYIL